MHLGLWLSIDNLVFKEKSHNMANCVKGTVHPKINCILSLFPAELFIHLDCFWCEFVSSGDVGCLCACTPLTLLLYC